MTVDYVAHGVTLAAAWFAVANLLASGGVALTARWIMRGGAPHGSASWLALRSLPAVASLAFIAAVFVPSYLRFEPRETAEGFDLTVTLCAAVGLGLIAAAATRGIGAGLRSARQAAVWARSAEPLTVNNGRLPAYSIGAAAMPLMTLAGIRSPRVFLSRRLMDVLTAEELSGALAHEASPARPHDNLKRLWLRLLPDALAGTSVAGAIEHRWALEAERAADRAATGNDPFARCTLAAALVKVARMMVPSARGLEPMSPLIGGGDLAQRVESLLDDPPARSSPRTIEWTFVGAVAAVLVAYAPLLRAVHQLTEVLVNSLP